MRRGRGGARERGERNSRCREERERGGGVRVHARVRAAALGAALAALAEPAQGTPGLHASGHDGKARGPSLVSGYPQNESYDASFAAVAACGAAAPRVCLGSRELARA